MDAAVALARQIADLERRLSAVERGSRLARSSVEIDGVSVSIEDTVRASSGDVTNASGVLPIDHGGTGSTSAPAALLALGAASTGHTHAAPFPPATATSSVATVFGTSGGTAGNLAVASFASNGKTSTRRALVVGYFGWSSAGAATGEDEFGIRASGTDTPIVTGVVASNQGATGLIPRTFVGFADIPPSTPFDVYVKGSAVTNTRTGKELTVQLIYVEA